MSEEIPKNAVNSKTSFKRKKAKKPPVTRGTVKYSCYLKEESLEQLENYKYWERLSMVEAFNNVIRDGLKDKNTKPRDQS